MPIFSSVSVVWMTRRILFLAALSVFFSVLPLNAVAEQTVTVAWRPSSDSTVVGYRVYTREGDSTNKTQVDVGANALGTVSGLKEGLRYGFTVTSYNAAGVESVPSPEVAITLRVPLRIVPGATPSSAKRLQFPAAPGKWYEVQASTDLKTWTTIWQTGVASTYSWTEFQDVQSVLFKSRFYRLIVH